MTATGNTLSGGFTPSKITPVAAAAVSTQPLSPNVAHISFTAEWFTDLLKPYGFMAVGLTVTNGMGVVSAIAPTNADSPNVVAPTFSFVDIQTIDPALYAVNLTFGLEWFAGMIVANGWGSATTLSMGDSGGAIAVRILTGCTYGSISYGVSTIVLVPLQLRRADADAEQEKHRSINTAAQQAAHNTAAARANQLAGNVGVSSRIGSLTGGTGQNAMFGPQGGTGQASWYDRLSKYV